MRRPFAASSTLRAVLRIATATPEQWQTAALSGGEVSAWDAARAGLTLALADGPDYRRRVDAVQQAEQRARQQQEQASRERITERRAQLGKLPASA